ncbi:MAG: hypothetical protein IPG64_11390 [Haliea sp.]|nr:hypothetical protein [Haliea sp.]
MAPNTPAIGRQAGAGDDLETRTQAALIDAEPNTVIELPAGTFHFKGELSISVGNIVPRKGNSANGGTVLNFAGQTSARRGSSPPATIVVEDLAVEDTPGDGIKMEGNDGVTMRRVRVSGPAVPTRTTARTACIRCKPATC